MPSLQILNVDGCLLDTLVTCVTGAFLDLQLPKVDVDFDDDITVNINEAILSEESEHIALAGLPVLSTFIVLDADSPDKVGYSSMKLLLMAIRESGGILFEGYCLKGEGGVVF